MLSQLKLLLITALTLSVFSFSSMAADSIAEKNQAHKVKAEQGATKVEETQKKQKACDFRISTA